ncbi:hypothetical protein GGR56DRAFT_662064 [Xylariaceae sp. FL0804]|nr:hypothetical protein GGR56DRAFT_662064 [Xylariaceae sp. FL0804]
MSFQLDQIGSLPPAEQQAILNGPSLTPPGNTSPDFTDPPNGNALAYAVLTICLFVSTLALLVRWYARVICVRSVSLVDYLSVVAYGLFLSYIITTYMLVNRLGFFVHQWDIRVKDLSYFLWIIHICSDFYAAVMLIMKPAILWEWCRIFVPRGIRNSFFWASLVVGGLCIIFYTVSIFLENLACFPYKRIWDKTVPGSACVDTKTTIVAGAAANIVLDLITIILPQKTIWSLQMSRKRKIGISMIFAIGVLACAAAAARLAFSIKFYLTADETYATAALSFWCMAEMTCMFLIFCGPAAPKAFSHRGLFSNIASKFGKRYASSQEASGASSNQKNPASRNYRKIQDNVVPLTDFTVTGLEGIVCTKDFTREDGYEQRPHTKAQAEDNVKHQLPWEAQR